MTKTQPFRYEKDGRRVTGRYALPETDLGAPLLVAFHGGGNHSGYYDLPSASLLRTGALAGVPVLALDRPGYAESTGPAEGAESLDEIAVSLVAPLAAAVEQVAGGRPAVLLGHSAGGAIAARIAGLTQLPFVVAGLSLSGLGAELGPPALAMAGSLPETGVLHRPPDEFFLPLMFGRPESYSQAALAELAEAEWPLPVSEARQANDWATDYPRIAAAVTVPVQIIMAGSDVLWPATQESLLRLKEAFASDQVDAVVLPHAGHLAELHFIGQAERLRQLAFTFEAGAQLQR
jgi:pimeloyl-ACP methyl ester carboxylesterase